MKRFWLFGTSSAGLPRGKRILFRLWNGSWVLLSAVALGVLSLGFAYGRYTNELFYSYWQHPLLLALNLLPVVGLMLLSYALFGRAWAAFLLSSVLTMGLSWGNYYKLLFRDDPLMFSDIALLREANSIVQTAGYDLTPPFRLWLSALCIVGGVLFLRFLVRGVPGGRFRAALALTVAVSGVLLAKTYRDETVYETRTANDTYINRWAATQVYISKGFVYPFLHSATSGILREPEGYDEKAAREWLAAYTDAEIPAEQKVDLLFLQLEAFADFSDISAAQGVDWEKAYAAYHAWEKESLTGNLVNNIFAGGTVDTERAVLTGYAHQWNYRSATNSQVWYLARQGYYVEGSHPSYEWFYNRRNVNDYLGLSQYYFQENYYGALTNGGIAMDEVLLPEILRLYRLRQGDADTPYFSFNVTYQGHGPYDSTQNLWGETFTDGRYSPQTTNILDNYLGSVKSTAEQLWQFKEALEQQTRPVVVVVFGDHKPWLGDGNSVYQELNIDLSDETEDSFYHYYATRYLIWGNAAARKLLGKELTGEGPDVSSCFLTDLVFESLGWQGSAWTQATAEIRRTLPVITVLGRYREGDTFTAELSDAGAAALKKYWDLEYYYSRHFAYS